MRIHRRITIIRNSRKLGCRRLPKDQCSGGAKCDDRRGIHQACWFRAVDGRIVRRGEAFGENYVFDADGNAMEGASLLR